MTKHTREGDCPLCEEKLKEAHPKIADWFVCEVKPRYSDAHISWSFRGKEAQEEAYAKGLSNRKWPESPHNNMVDARPCSLALDLFQIDSDGRAVFNPRFYFDLSKLSDEIIWGGTFKSIADKCHFELKESP